MKKNTILTIFLILLITPTFYAQITTKTPENDFTEIKGSWSVNCAKERVDFDSNENNVYLFLYSDNSIYINCLLVKDKENSNAYQLFFNNVDSQENYYPEKLHVIEQDIAKNEPIAKLLLKNNKLELQWYGLYNTKSNQREFLDDFVIYKENGSKLPILLNKCDN